MVLGMKTPQVNVNGSASKIVSEMNPLGIEYHKNRSRMKISLDIASAIYRNDGFRGYYRGYVASLMAYVPNSALWWTFYHIYQGKQNSDILNTIPVSLQLHNFSIDAFFGLSNRKIIECITIERISFADTMRVGQFGRLHHNNHYQSIRHSPSTIAGTVVTSIREP